MKSQALIIFRTCFFSTLNAITDTKMVNLLLTISTLVLFSGVGASYANVEYSVDSFQKISALEGDFGSGLESPDLFGHAVADVGDLDGDGNIDIAVGAFGDDDGGFNTGAVWILFLNADGTVKSKQKISDTQGGLIGDLSTNALFGAYLASLDDLDGDGVTDLIVGNYGDDDGGFDRGAAWVLFLNSDGTVKAEQKISDLQGGFGGSLDNSDFFGRNVAKIGDLDGDGVTEIAVGAVQDDDAGVNRGAVWILFMNANGTVKTEQKISDTQGGFNGVLSNSDLFGQAIAGIGDVDGDGTTDLAVSASNADDGGLDRGAVWILFMNSDGSVKAEQKISDTQGGFLGTLDNSDLFGWSLSKAGDLDLDGVPDVIVGADGDDDGGVDKGAVWLLFLNANGTVKAEQKISATTGGFNGELENGDRFGSSITHMTDLDGNGVVDLVVGARTDDDGGNATGAVWVLFLKTNIVVPPPIGGSVTGIIPDSINCLNQMTSQNISFSPDSGSTSWNCEAQGLVAGPGDRIVMTVSGLVPRAFDFNKDGCIDISDVQLVIAEAQLAVPRIAYDVNGDGEVNIADARALVLLADNPGAAACY